MAAEAEPKDLKGWMRKQDIYDNDLYDILTSQGVETPAEDFKTYTQSQWDELWRKGCVERAKELKDQKAKVRLEKKMTKLEKYWRKQSGIKSTSVKKKGKKKEASDVNNSASAKNEALASGNEIKKFLKKEGCFSPDLVEVLVNVGITSPDDLTTITKHSYDEIFRQIRVRRAQDLKDNAARVRMEKMMEKFAKLCPKEIRTKSAGKKGGKGKKKKAAPKDKEIENMQSGGAKLKAWMRKNDVWEMALYEELMANEISEAEQLKDITQDTFDAIVRKVRVDRFSQLKDQKARNRADKLLIKFEKEWRKASGIKKTSIKNK